MDRFLGRFAASIVVAVAIASVAAMPARAQDASLRIEVVGVSDGVYPSARAIINIEDTSPGGLPQLTPEDFTVLANGSPAAVSSVELANSEDAPLDLVVVIDTSGSMEGAPLASAKAAAKAFINDLPPADRVSIINFGDEVTMALDFTNDRLQAAAAIDGLVARGNTALYQAATVAAIKAGSSMASRRAIVLLSDGADFGGRSIATREESIIAVTNAAVPVFAIAFGNDLDRAYLQQTADVSKGRYLEAPNPQDLQALYAGIGRILRSQYVVTFDAAAIATTPQTDLQITLKSGERIAEDQAIYRPLPNFVPPVAIIGIADGETLDAARELTLSISGDVVVTNVAWLVDEVPVAESSTPPFAFIYDPASFGGGDHMVRAAVQVGTGTLDTPVVQFASAPPATPGGGSLPIIPLAGAGGAIFLVLLAGFLFIRARASRPPKGIPVDQRTIPWVAQLRKDLPERAEDETPVPVLVEEVGEPKGVLISRAGADLGAEYVIGATPVSVGSAASCAVRIDDPELGGVEARVWVRGGHLMLHKMTRLSAIAADGTTGGWMILDEGDRFDVGAHSYEFRLLPPDVTGMTQPGMLQRPPVDAEPAPFPNVLRGAHDAPAGAPPQTDDPSSQSSRLRLSELMPRDDGGTMRQPED
jgi:VWFA-related protein